MGKKKTPTFSKLVCEALTQADDEKGMNAKLILDFIKQKHSIGSDDKANLGFIHKELERGKEAGEYLQVQGNSAHGHFKFNLSYVPPSKSRADKLPDYSNPPEAPKETLEAPIQEPTKKRRQRKNKETDSTTLQSGTSSNPVELPYTPSSLSSLKLEPTSPAESPYTLLYCDSKGQFKTGKVNESGNMKFSTCKSLPYLSRAQIHLLPYLEKKKAPMPDEEVKRMSNDPLFRRLYTQANSGITYPELQRALDKTGLKANTYPLRGDRVDSLRMGIHSHAGELDAQMTEEFKQLDLCEDEEPANQSNQVSQSSSHIEERQIEWTPKTETEIKQMTCRDFAAYLVDGLRSPIVEHRRQSLLLMDLNIKQSPRLKTLFVEVGAISALIDCVSVDNSDLSRCAINLLFILYETDPTNCEKMIEANLFEKLLMLATSGNFKKLDAEAATLVLNDRRKFASNDWNVIQAGVSLLAEKFAGRIDTTKLIISKKKFNDLINLLLELMHYVEGQFLVNPICLVYELLNFYFAKDFNLIGSFSDQKIQFLYSKIDAVDYDLKTVFINTLIILICTDGERLVPFLTDLGFIGKMVELFECGEMSTLRSLVCFWRMIDFCFEGYKYVYNANIVPKLLPFLSSQNNDIQKAVTNVFASLIDSKYELMAPQMDLSSFITFYANLKKFDLCHGTLNPKLLKLHALIENQNGRGTSKKSKQKIRRKR